MQKELEHHKEEIKGLKARLRFFIGIAMLFVIALFTMAFVIMNSHTDFLIANTHRNNTICENDQLILKLKSLRSEYDLINKNFKENMDSIVRIQTGEVADMIHKIEGLKITDHNQKKVIAQLQKQLSQYLIQIELLEEKNKNLTQKYNQIKTSFDSLFQNLASNDNFENKTVQSNNKTITTSPLRAYEISTMTYRVEKGKDQLSRKASKINKARICFKITESRQIKKQNINIYCKISKPNDIFPNTDNNNIIINGKNINYTFSQKVNYDGKPTDVCLTWECNKTLSKGTYTADLYSEDQFIGQSIFTLD